MSNISVQIESHLKQLLQDATNGMIEIQRNALSQIFDCVPSQINYVLSTRFTPAHGFLIETRRGGGGYVRIIRVDLDSASEVREFLEEREKEGITEQDVGRIIGALKKNDLIDNREAALLNSLCQDNFLEKIMNTAELRMEIIKRSVLTLLREDLDAAE